MRSLTVVLGILLVLALMCLYQVSGSLAAPAREGFDSSLEGDVDGKVFSAWMTVHGVPPSPPVSKFYADVAQLENLDKDGIESKMREDASKGDSPDTKSSDKDVSESSELSGDAVAAEPNVTVATDEDMDMEVAALREKMTAAKEMSGPVRTSPRIADQARKQLRQIAGQVAELALQFEKGEENDKRPEPKGIEQFISFR